MANADGQKREVASSFAITGNYKNETKTVSIDFDEDFSEYFEIPSDWYVRFTDSANKVFKALPVHVAMPAGIARPPNNK